MSFDGGPVLPDPDRHYWRRRVNRHVRKARRTRTLLRVAGVVAANALLGFLLFLAGASALRHVTTSRELSVTEILVDGTSRTTPDAVRSVLRPLFGRNILELDLGEVARAATKDPWVREASVKRILPGSLRVSVAERTPAALALLGGLVYVVDDQGVVMGPAGPDLPYDLPVLTGLGAYKGKALEEAIAAGVALLAKLSASHPAWTAGISELDLSSADRVTVTRLAGGPAILLDPERADRNLDDYLALQPLIAKKVGSVSTVDLRWNRRIALHPQGEPPLPESE